MLPHWIELLVVGQLIQFVEEDIDLNHKNLLCKMNAFLI